MKTAFVALVAGLLFVWWGLVAQEPANRDGPSVAKVENKFLVATDYSPIR
ncbi:MAG: hypothetical protein KatS3mg110_1735 [Pirellulaceae bacterium]|nr:MAG: hypothetical protein KatS3mg110_1735 [Pirellulaceae bacterium]